MNRIVIIGSGCGLLEVMAYCAEQGVEVVVSKTPPPEPEPMRMEFKAPVIKSIDYQQMFYPPNPRPWERKKKGQRR